MYNSVIKREVWREDLSRPGGGGGGGGFSPNIVGTNITTYSLGYSRGPSWFFLAKKTFLRPVLYQTRFVLYFGLCQSYSSVPYGLLRTCLTWIWSVYVCCLYSVKGSAADRSKCFLTHAVEITRPKPKAVAPLRLPEFTTARALKLLLKLLLNSERGKDSAPSSHRRSPGKKEVSHHMFLLFGPGRER